MSLTISLLIIVFLIVVQTTIPYLVKRTIVFGVTIPEQFIQEKNLLSFKKQYTFYTIVLSFVLLGGYLIWVFMNTVSDEQIILIGMIIAYAIILISLSFYFYFHRKTYQLKIANKWVDNLKQVRMTDLSVRSQDAMLPWYIYLLPMIVTIGLIGYTLLRYDTLPEQIPKHWGPSGEADAFAEKTLFSANLLPLFLLILQLMFLGIQVGTKNSGIKLSSTNVKASKNRQLLLRKYSSWLTFSVVLLLTMLFSYFQLTIIYPDFVMDGVKFLAPFVFLLFILFITLAFTLKVGRSDKEITEKVDDQITDIDEDSYWKGGLIYFNKNDPSIFVEKRFGIGWTINFANPLGYFIIFVPIVIILLITFL